MLSTVDKLSLYNGSTQSLADVLKDMGSCYYVDADETSVLGEALAFVRRKLALFQLLRAWRRILQQADRSAERDALISYVDTCRACMFRNLETVP